MQYQAMRQIKNLKEIKLNLLKEFSSKTTTALTIEKTTLSPIIHLTKTNLRM